ELRHDVALLVDVEELVAQRREDDAGGVEARQGRVEHVAVVAQADAQVALRLGADGDEGQRSCQNDPSHDDSNLYFRASHPTRPMPSGRADSFPAAQYASPGSSEGRGRTPSFFVRTTRTALLELQADHPHEAVLDWHEALQPLGVGDQVLRV